MADFVKSGGRAKLGGGDFADFIAMKKEDPGHARFVKGQFVWLPGKGAGPPFIPAMVKTSFDYGSDGDGVLVFRRKKKLVNVKVDADMSKQIVTMGEENKDIMPDFDPGQLVDVSEAALFHNTRARFDMGYKFQTVGPNVLLFLNNEFETDVPTLSSLSDWGDADLEDALKDDPDGICRDTFNSFVERAYQRLVASKGKHSQSLVISGCAGSGKRDITRYVLLKSIQLSRPKDAAWWQKLLAGDLLLQEFGGETGYFRWTELQLIFHGSNGQPELLGAVCNAFGLDQSRVTDKDQALFPVFSGLAKARKLRTDVHAFMQRSSEGSSQSKPWQEVKDAFKQLGLDEDGCKDIEDILMGILDTGNIQFADARQVLGKDKKGKKKVRELDEDELRARELELEEKMGDASKLVLGVPLGELRNALKIKTLRVKHETFEKERNITEKYAGRDGLARVLYALMFDWIIHKVNMAVSRIGDTVSALSAKDKSGVAARISKRLSQARPGGGSKIAGTIGIIGVLENSALSPKLSSLEDLYQNYRLERLQSFFAFNIAENNAVLLAERANVKGAHVHPSVSNETVLRLFMGTVHDKYRAMFSPTGAPLAKRALAKSKVSAAAARFNKGGSSKRLSGSMDEAGCGSPLGILQLVEEETYLPAGSDKALASKISRKATRNMSLCKTSTIDFTVTHFGGIPVEYSIQGFVDRSRANIVPQQVLRLLREHSEIPLLREVSSFSRDPIGQSGVMAKRELESMLELDNKAVQAAAENAANIEEDGSSEGVGSLPPGERIGHAEVAKRIFNEMNRATTILGRTQVQYVFALASNAASDPTAALDGDFLLAQLQELGLSNAVCSTLHSSLRGSGMPVPDFVKRYAPIYAALRGTTPTEGRKAAAQKSTTTAFLAAFKYFGLVPERQWELSGQAKFEQKSILFTPSAHFALETALLLINHQAATLIQSMARAKRMRAKYLQITARAK